MQWISAADAARRFSQVLDAVDRNGQSFIVTRRGRAVACIGPAAIATGAMLFDIVDRHSPDADWARDLRDLREGLDLTGRPRL